jgi:hypothetical protein
MKLKEYIDMVLAEMPIKAKVSFDIAIKTKKDKNTKQDVMFVDYGYEAKNKIKFNITKLGQ